jgi:1,2-phenylacetyl-CoA epoxidase catalytic subunit
MTAPAAERLLPILESQGVRELVSAHLLAAGLPLAPTIDDKHMLADHAREELAHFEVVGRLYEQLTGNALYEVVARRANEVPVPQSWLEAAVAAYLVDRAAALQLREYQQVGDPRLDQVIDSVLEHEHEHMTAAETALVDQCRATPTSAKQASAHVARWFGIARRLLDGGTDARVAHAFAASVQATLTACGIELPAVA